ncbi:MAG TPA: ABC transporter ATP-binding protein [Rugosimonospora sp.]|nr:ABC transporter ATP-binding protein [Rugosimonospora sp.]
MVNGDAAVLRSVTKAYGAGSSRVVALDDVSLGFAAGQFTAVMGPSGSGKSTLLQCTAGLDRPDTGSIVLDGKDLTRMSESGLSKLRRDRIGFVFQSFNLIPSLTAAQNVALPLLLASRKPRLFEVREALAQVGLAERTEHRPHEMSIGQQQRVAIARALIAQPAVLFADEPTGALDTKTGRDVLALLRGLVDERQQTIIMVTHDPNTAAYAHRVVFLADGRVAGSLENPTPAEVTARMSHLAAPAH